VNVADEVEDGQEVELEPVVVKEGQAKVLLAAGDVQQGNLLADRSKFTTKLPMGGQLPISQKYVKAVLASRPLSYWRFESIDGDEVQSEVKPALPLKVIGEVALTGDARNHSLELGVSAGDGHLITDKKMPFTGSDYTVELWCKPNHFHHGAMVILGQDASNKHKTKFGHCCVLKVLREGSENLKLPPGCIRFIHRDTPSIRIRDGASCFSGQPYKPRSWQHVVAVKQKTNLQLYVNGQLLDETKGEAGLARNLRVIVGEAFFRDHAMSPISYFGQVDELAIYDRALSNKELLEHFRAVEAESQILRQPTEL
jgi:hypothetical protein